MDNFWSTCLLRFEKELSPQQFNTWIKPLRVDVRPDTIRLLAPNRFVQQWIKDKFYTKIQSIADELLPDHIIIELDIHTGDVVPNNKNGAHASTTNVDEIPIITPSLKSKHLSIANDHDRLPQLNGQVKIKERRTDERGS
ncbi:MAG: chromosomal replication initiation protein DnaA, partial [Methylophilales bacterium 16-45-7]